MARANYALVFFPLFNYNQIITRRIFNMSVINRIPLLDTILSKLNGTMLGALKDCIDGKGPAPVFRTLKPYAEGQITASDKDKVQPVLLELNAQTAQSVYKGYLIYNDEVCALIGYADEGGSLLTIITITGNTYAIDAFECTITDLRSTLGDYLVEAGENIHVQAGDIDSGSETAGKVLMADGSGGAEWGDAAGGGSEVIDLSSLTGENTFADLFALCGIDLSTAPEFSATTYGTFIFSKTPNSITNLADGVAKLGVANFGSPNAIIDLLSFDGERYFAVPANSLLSATFDNYPSKKPLIPSTADLTEGKTYNLQSVNGGDPSWQEASSGGGLTKVRSGGTINIDSSKTPGWNYSTSGTSPIGDTSKPYFAKVTNGMSNVPFVLFEQDSSGSVFIAYYVANVPSESVTISYDLYQQ